MQSSTGQYCDPQILAWSNKSSMGANESCSDCWLGCLSMQLNSPLGYDDGLASNFESLTSSCNATAYPFTSPPPYAINSTATTSVPATVTTTTPPVWNPTAIHGCLVYANWYQGCTGSYTVDDTDDCISVSKSLMCQHIAFFTTTTLTYIARIFQLLSTQPCVYLLNAKHTLGRPRIPVIVWS